MSLLEMVGSILTELEKVHGKLDKLLAKPFKLVKKEVKVHDIDELVAIDLIKKDSNETKEEEVIMDLTEVQCIATTEKAILVTKKGYQKWIPISQLSENTKTIEEGDYLESIELTEKAKNWIPNKPWEKFKVVKG